MSKGMGTLRGLGVLVVALVATSSFSAFGAVIEVSDTGIGIHAEDAERVFERFYRADKARSRELGGTGLGLAIVKHLALGLAGSATVESEPGDGSTFRVRLPLHRDPR